MLKMKSGPNSGVSALEAERSSRQGDAYRVPCLTARPKEEVKLKEQVESKELIESKEIVELKEQIQPQERVELKEKVEDFHQSDPNFEKKRSLGLFHAWAAKLRGVLHKSAKQEYLLTGVEEDETQAYPLTGTDEGKTPKHLTSGVDEGKTQLYPLTGIDEGKTPKHLTSGADEGKTQENLHTKVDKGKKQIFLFTGGDEDVPRPDSLPPKLPNELWLQIMRYLAPGSLWALRLSSPVFFNLFNKSQGFRQFHGTPGLKDRYVRFSLESMTKLERKKALRMLRRDEPAASNLAKDPQSYCGACNEVLNRGENDPMMIKLRETRFCDGCKERHLCVFFPPESIDLHDRELLDELLCVGRLGTATLCSHKLAESLTWNKIGNGVFDPRGYYRPLEPICTEACHEPSSRDSRGIDGSSCPKMSARYAYMEETFNLELGWDRPLLDIDPEYPPSVKDIRRAVANLLDGAFAQHKPCRHMLDGQQLRAFAFSGICKCFLSRLGLGMK